MYDLPQNIENKNGVYRCQSTSGSTLYYYVNDKLHREDGPAIIYQRTGTKKWFMNGLRHRLDGPAVIRDTSDPSGIAKEYWLYGKRVSMMEVEEERKRIETLKQKSLESGLELTF